MPEGGPPLANPVKDAIDAHSGRFEFFKQTLTLGSVGLAGIAALFTDPARVPTDTASLVLAAIAGLSLMEIVAASAFGLSAYANLLRALAIENRLIPPSPNAKSDYTSIVYADGVVSHAKWVVGGLFAAWLSLLAFAAVKVFVPQTTGITAALAAAKELVTKEAGQPDGTPVLERLEVIGSDYVIIYLLSGQKYTVSVAREGAKVIKFVKG